jgi:DNA-binding IclR family transcriptional regulator
MRQPIGVSELARVTEIPKSTVQRGLVTLQQAGWLKVVDAERARWGVTSKALALGLRNAGERDLQEVAEPVLKRLAAQTDETVMLGVRDGECLLILAREDTTQVVRVFLEVGARVPLRATSAGPETRHNRAQEKAFAPLVMAAAAEISRQLSAG